MARQASNALNTLRAEAPECSTKDCITSAGGNGNAGRQMVSQNSRSLCTRISGGLPAITAVLSAPIEMPATQFGSMPAAASPSYTPA